PLQTATRLGPGGGAIGGIASPGWARFSASAIRKKSGAATSTPMNAGLLRPSKLPIQTTRTNGPTTPADQASRNPHDVPVFHAIGQRARAGMVPASSGRGL